jgi:aerobic C4-dicarboxylate transport protein
MKIFKHLYAWVLCAILIGIGIGIFFPTLGESLKPLGDLFIALVKMLIAPIIFCTVVSGIGGAGEIKKVGRIGLKALIYFEVVSSLALTIGLLVVNILKPGQGLNADLKSIDPSVTALYSQNASDLSFFTFISHIVPKSFFDAFTDSGSLLQVLLLAVMFGWAMNKVGSAKAPIAQLIEAATKILFAMMNGIMKLAPIGAGGAMAYTVGKFGAKALLPLTTLLGAFYLSCVVFIIAVLGLISRLAGFSLFSFLEYIGDELLLVLGTSSSESGLVPLMEKLEKLGCSKSVVNLVVPTGYSFNLDGTNIYLSMAAIFIAQAFNIDLSMRQQLSLLAVAILTSKGASGVTGAGFITLAATLTVVPDVPVAGLALILGVDRFMSEARALTNFIGNGVGTLVIAKWENELDLNKLQSELHS